MPAGRVVRDLIGFTDMLPTLAEIGGAELPKGIALDGRSFAPQLRGEKGNPPEWVFVQLFHNMDRQKFPAGRWYVRGDRWKLNESGELFDMSDAPFSEKLVASDTTDPAAGEARKHLGAVLAQLNPAAGKTEPAPPAQQPRKKQDKPATK
jgi:arylsulfatase A